MTSVVFEVEHIDEIGKLVVLVTEQKSTILEFDPKAAWKVPGCT
jgi:hypothetical protein